MDLEQATLLDEEAERSERLAGSGEVERLAVVATFDPARLTGTDGAEILRLLCRRLRPRAGGDEAILVERCRVDALAEVLRRSGPEGLRELRADVEPDYAGPLQRVLDAVIGGDRRLPVDLDDENDLLAAVEVLRWVDQAFAHAGLAKPVVEPTKDAIFGRLALLDVTHAVRRLVAAGCVGRDAELARLHDYRTSRSTAYGLGADPAMVVYGIGGVGKSTLVARFVMDLHERLDSDDRWAWAYVDLDRPTLASGDALVVLNDIVGQVAAQFPAHRRVLRRVQEIAYLRKKGAGLEAADTAHSVRARASEFAGAFHDLGARSLVVVVDTFEELERRNPERGRDLYDLFDVLSDGIEDFRLVVSGRRPAACFVDRARPDRAMRVEPLAEDAAVTLLRHFVRESGSAVTPDVGDGPAREIIRLVGGIPLTVRLAATVLVREGPDAVADAASYARTMAEVRTEFVRGFLYQRILDHIDVGERVRTDELRRIARAGLVLRRITRGLVEDVLVPAVGLSPAPPATELFDQLASEVALVEVEGDELHLREELRGPALAALRLTDLATVQEVHRRAVDHFAALLPDPAANLELAYHRLALGRLEFHHDAATLRQLEPSLADLPEASAALVRRALEDPLSLRESEDLARWERGVLSEGEGLLHAGGVGDLARLRALLDERPDRTPGSELHRLESRLAESQGDLAGAADAARREVDAATAVSDAARTAAGAVRLCGLLERLGAISAAERVLAETADGSVLAGRAELRLELLLNRMTLLERRDRLGEEDRWSAELAVRALLQRSDPRNLASDGAVVRLLAAALGREEPERIRAAVRSVGLGFDEDADRVSALAVEIADWDAASADPGSLARASGLRPGGIGRAEIHRAWTAISGLGAQAGPLLDRVWTADPPERVREAFRRLYLWWGQPAAPETTRSAGPGDAGPGYPIDWSRPEVRTLEEILLTAYHSVTDLQVLASRAGLDLKRISWSSTQRRVVRELLAQAAEEARLGALVTAILEDPETTSVHPRVEELAADADFRAWLAPEGGSA